MTLTKGNEYDFLYCGDILKIEGYKFDKEIVILKSSQQVVHKMLMMKIFI